MNVISLVRQRKLVVALCVLVGVVIATSYAHFVVTPTYSATMKMYVSGTGLNSDDKLKNGEYARTHVSSYTDMVDSNDILQAVRTKLGLPQTQDGTYRDLASSITATNRLDTLIIDVTVQATSPQKAQAVAAAIGDVYDPVVARMENTGVNSSPVRISVFSAPTLPVAPTSPSLEVYAAAGLALGAALGLGLAWVLERRSAKRRLVQTAAEERALPDSWSWQLDPGVRDQPRPTAVRRIRGRSSGNGGSPTTEEQGGADEQRAAGQ